MKYVTLLIFWVCSIKLGYTQNKSFTTFRDYLLPASNLDSLKKVESSRLLNPQSIQDLHLLIAIEFGKSQRGDSMTIQQYNKIIHLATQHKSQLGLGMINYLLAQRNVISSESNDDAAYTYIVKAQKHFTQIKDTTGILHCLRLSTKIFGFVTTFGPLTEKELVSLNRDILDKLIALSQKSEHPIDQFIYYEAIASCNPAFKSKSSENQIDEAFRKANEITDKHPHLAFLRKYIYRATQQGYNMLRKTDKVLEYTLKTLHHPAIKADYWDYRNAANTYMKLKKYDKTIEFLKEAIRRIKIEYPNNLRQLRGMYRHLKNAYFEIGDLKESIKAYDEYDKYNNLIHQSDRRLAVYQIREKYSYTEKETELKRISLEKQVAESRNKLLQLQYDAEKREAALKTFALENQAQESKEKLLNTQMDVVKKEDAIQLAQSQKRLLFGGLIMTLAMVGIVLFFSIRLRKTNFQLLELQQARDKFYTIIAHDLRSPLNTLNSLGTLLNHLIRQGKTQELDKVVQQIENMSEQSNLLLNNLFEWGKSQYFTNDPAAKPDTFDAVPFLQMLCDHYLSFAEAKRVTLSTAFPSSLFLKADQKGFEMTVRNLLDNALKHTPGGGEITVSGTNSEEGTPYHSIMIADTGAGIAPEQLRYLQKVFSGKAQPEVGIHGLGLGMVLIHHFVQKQKATLTVESEVEKGSCFRLIFGA